MLHRVGAHDADEMIARQVAVDLLPGLTVIARAQDVRLEIIDAVRVERRISHAVGERGDVERLNLGPERNASGCHVAPMRPAVTRQLDQSVVSATQISSA